MGQDQARDLLHRSGVLRHPCDLDLLLFFARHPHTHMASEQLASMTGYGLQQTAESLDRLLKAGLLTRTQNPTHTARMYVFTAPTDDGWLPPLLEFASTRLGRLAMRQALARPLGEPSLAKGKAKATEGPPADEPRRSGS